MGMPAHHPHARRKAAKAKAIQARRRFYAAIKEIDALIGALPTAFDVPMNQRDAIADDIERVVAPYVEAAALLAKNESTRPPRNTSRARSLARARDFYMAKAGWAPFLCWPNVALQRAYCVARLRRTLRTRMPAREINAHHKNGSDSAQHDR